MRQNMHTRPDEGWRELVGRPWCAFDTSRSKRRASGKGTMLPWYICIPLLRQQVLLYAGE